MGTETQRLEVVEIPDHCQNAPRKLVIRDFLVALYGRRAESVLPMLAGTFQWDIFGTTTLTEPADVQQWIRQQPIIRELKLHTIITHGTQCGADGVVQDTNDRLQVFNHVFIFTGHTATAKIRKIRSYILAL